MLDGCELIRVLYRGVPVTWRTAAIHRGKTRMRSIQRPESKWLWPTGRPKVRSTVKWSTEVTVPRLSCEIPSPACGICATRRKSSNCGRPSPCVPHRIRLPVISRCVRERWPCRAMDAGAVRFLAWSRPRRRQRRRNWISIRSSPIRLELPLRMFSRY